MKLIFSDAFMLAVEKPSGLLSVPGKGADKQDCMLSRMQAVYPDALLVHRLDMDTSGLMLFARSLEAQRALSMQFEKRAIEKVYIAWVEGCLVLDEGEIDLPLRKDMEQALPPRHMVDLEQGKPAQTRWRVRDRLETQTRVELVPLTGRSHQLRVHMQSLGHPIVGDPIYGTPDERLMLHAQRLSLDHPMHGDRIELESISPF
ncbi:MAG: RNA pseudouridine synthase [Kiritimatiellaceae bacterium]|jgi:tRNA pseudouridine32 synthase/23S rRNA pseudouridine746 synthase|nr:RNA pseudouridine synthase [Kiritimatiellaceae bacterium]|tara:strand:- start:209 stop:817 length:609 start_codon:yes stop_codon:yes gene_type:complete